MALCYESGRIREAGGRRNATAYFDIDIPAAATVSILTIRREMIAPAELQRTPATPSDRQRRAIGS